MGIRVLVTGGRDYNDAERVNSILDAIHALSEINLLIEGGANGADFLAACWANAYEVEVQEFEADWAKHGRAAGPIRNQTMLAEGKPDLVVAFPGGRGTADMVRLAKIAGVAVVEVESGPATRRAADTKEVFKSKAKAGGS